MYGWCSHFYKHKASQKTMWLDHWFSGWKYELLYEISSCIIFYLRLEYIKQNHKVIPILKPYLIFSGFSYNMWRVGKKISAAGLSNSNLVLLMQDLGLAQFVYKDNQRCSSSRSPFIGATDNWINGELSISRYIGGNS